MMSAGTMLGAHRLLYLCGIYSHLSNDAMVQNFNGIRNHAINQGRPAVTLLGPKLSRSDMEQQLTADAAFAELAEHIPDDAVKFYCSITTGIQPTNGTSMKVPFRDLQIIPGYYVLPFFEALYTLEMFNESRNATDEDPLYTGPDGETLYFPIFGSFSGDYIALNQSGAVFEIYAELDDPDTSKWDPIAENLVEFLKKNLKKLEKGDIEKSSSGVLEDLEEKRGLLEEHGSLEAPRRPPLRMKRYLRRHHGKLWDDLRHLRRIKRGQTLQGQATATRIGGILSTSSAAGAIGTLNRVRCQLQRILLPLRFPCRVMPFICDADAKGVVQTGHTWLYRHNDPKLKKTLSYLACKDLLKEIESWKKQLKWKNDRKKKFPLWCEEYPFASTMQAGLGAYVEAVPMSEQKLQAKKILKYYRRQEKLRTACRGTGKSGKRKKFWFRYQPR